MLTRHRPFILGSALALIACGGSSLLSPDEVRELQHAESRWHARANVDYTYEIQQLCFCPPEINQWARVTVRGGVVVAAVPAESNAQFPINSITFWQPIDSLFARLRTVNQEGSASEVYSDVVVEYDALVGYPTFIEWKERPNVADAGAVYHLRNYQGLPPAGIRSR